MSCSPAPTESMELSAGGFEMLREAVNLARQHNIKTVAQLRKRMYQQNPSRTDDVDKGLRFWAAHTKTRHPNGPTD